MSKNVSQLPAATLPLSTADLVPVWQGGAQKQTAIPNMAPDLTNVPRIVSTVTVGAGGQSTITFTVPTGFNHCVIKILGRGDNAAETKALQLQFNGDSGSNYDYEQLTAVGATVAGAATTAQAAMQIANFNSAGATTSYPTQADIFIDAYYETSFYQTVLCTSNYRASNVNGVMYATGIWKNAIAIGTITFSLTGGNFAQGTIATLSME